MGELRLVELNKFIITEDKDILARESLFEDKRNKKIRKIKEKLKTSIARVEELHTINKNLSEKCDQVETEVLAAKSREASYKDKIKILDSDITDLRKELAIAAEHNQNFLLKKKEAQTGKEKAQKELNKMHEAFLKAIAHYKRKLHIRIRFDENRNIILHYLNVLTPESNMCCVKLSCVDDKWNLLESDPTLPCEKELAQRLETTQDLKGFISHVRKLFIQLCTEKKKEKSMRELEILKL